ncbi:MAG: apolipoprotein N-acyltransferase [Bacteroidetes bacterium]|nr:apolipoprotein N-acyltransferase [Bacteroidota bacterium]
MPIYQRYLFSILSGILLTLSFPYSGSITPLIFIALVPLLLVEEGLIEKNKNRFHFYPHSYITFLIYNLGTTWWIYNSTDVGAYMAFIFNSLLMTWGFQIYHMIHRKIGGRQGILSLIIVWTAFEWIHFNWELSWPWLAFGNVFSIRINWVQWYEYTGVLGGTIWVLVGNILFFKFYKSLFLKENRKETYKLISIAAGVLVIPIVISILILNSLPDNSNHKSYEVVVVQPNIDPYNEKFDPNATVDKQLQQMFELANQKVSSKTDLVICPETAISQGFVENELKDYTFYQLLENQLKTWGKTDLLIGASTYQLFEKKNSRASIKIPNAEGYFESYNSSLYMSKKNKATFIHKSKLVLGVEKIPFSQYFPFLEEYSINNGGTTGTLGIEPHPKIYKRKMDVAPIVCYESIYGEFVAKQSKQGADFLAILTNDGWWGNSPGHKQHFSFAKLRAIENRKWVARSANTGISGFIDEKGHIIQQSTYWTPDALKQTIRKGNKTTVYAIFGDYLGVFAFILLFPLIVWSFFKKNKNL